MSEAEENTQVAEPVEEEKTDGLQATADQETEEVKAEESTPEEPKAEDKPEEDEKKSRYAKRQAKIDKKIYQMYELKRQIDEREAIVQAKEAKLKDSAPDPDQYDDLDKYKTDLEMFNAKEIDRRANEIANKRLVETREKETFNKALTSYQLRKEQALESDPNFNTYDVSVNRILQAYGAGALARPIIESDNSTDIVSHLGQNPEECERIAQLPPHMALMEIGAIKRELTLKPKRKVSAAPPPIKPVRGTGTASRDMSEMSQADFEAMRNKQVYGR